MRRIGVLAHARHSSVEVVFRRSHSVGSLGLKHERKQILSDEVALGDIVAGLMAVVACVDGSTILDEELAYVQVSVLGCIVEWRVTVTVDEGGRSSCSSANEARLVEGRNATGRTTVSARRRKEQKDAEMGEVLQSKPKNLLISRLFLPLERRSPTAYRLLYRQAT